MKIRILLYTALISIGIAIIYRNLNTENQFVLITEKTSISLKKTNYNYGTLLKGKSKTCEFSFSNSGNLPLIIYKISTNCGCAEINWTKQPILPREAGSIKIKYDTKKLGSFRKTFMIIANVEKSPVVLTIEGKVIPE